MLNAHSPSSLPIIHNITQVVNLVHVECLAKAALFGYTRTVALVAMLYMLTLARACAADQQMHTLLPVKHFIYMTLVNSSK